MPYGISSRAASRQAWPTALVACSTQLARASVRLRCPANQPMATMQASQAASRTHEGKAATAAATWSQPTPQVSSPTSMRAKPAGIT